MMFAGRKSARVVLTIARPGRLDDPAVSSSNGIGDNCAGVIMEAKNRPIVWVSELFLVCTIDFFDGRFRDQ